MQYLSPYSLRRAFPDEVQPQVLNEAPLFLDEEENGLGLWDCWLIIQKRLRLILGLFLSVLVLTWLVMFSRTPIYTASSTIRVEPEAPQILDVAQLLSSNSENEDHDFYKTEIAALKSPTLAADVIRQLGLQNSPLFRPQQEGPTIIRRLRGEISSFVQELKYPRGQIWRDKSKDLVTGTRITQQYLTLLTVDAIPNTRLIKISFSTPDPVLSARIANAHVAAYIQRGLKTRQQAGESARAFLQQQLINIKQRVEESEAALNAYRRSHGIVSFSVDDTDKLDEARLSEMNRALTEAETNRIQFEAQLSQIKDGNFDSLPEVINSPLITSLKPEMDRLETQYAAMATQYRPKWPQLYALESKLNKTKERVAAEQADVARSVKRQYLAAVAREKQIRALVDAEKQRDLKLNDDALQDAILSREVETNRHLYENVLKRIQEVGVQEWVPVSNVTILDSADIPSLPSSPKVLQDLAISGMLALIIGLGLALLFHHIDSAFKTVEEIEKFLHLPSFALVPDFNRIQRTRIGITRPRLLALSLPYRRSANLSNRDANSLLNNAVRKESYRSIRNALLFSRAGTAPKSVLFTSAIPGEGKTQTTVNTALVFSETGSRTVLIDADLRLPRCHKVLNVQDSDQGNNRFGLSEVLVGRADPENIMRRAGENLSFIPAGSTPPNPPELLISAKMREFLSALTEKFDHVFIDAAPVMLASDTVGIATMVDGVIIVVAADTPKKAVQRTCMRLVLAGAKVLGFVFNRADVNMHEFMNYHEYRRYLSREAT